jgi:hypothetical protein
MEQRKLLITGCGRSGTLYAAELWQALGLDIRHERPVPPNGVMGEDGIASWFLAANDPDTPSGPNAQNYEFDVTIHQVRHPLKVIASVGQFILKEGERAPSFIERNVPETILSENEQKTLDEKRQLILQASRYWYHWNRLAEEKADFLVRIENLNNELPILCDYVGIDYIPEVMDNIPNNINDRRLHIHEEPWVLDWSDIKNLDPQLYEKIRDLAATYGYVE